MAQASVTRKTRFAVVEESSEGSLKAPSSGSDFIALQPGFSLNGNVEKLSNEELKGSIGKSQSITGIESPEGSLDHYLYTSGVEGVEPETHLLIKSVFGDSVTASTEYDTVAASTAGDDDDAAVIKVDSGEGVNFERGQALLIKDSSGGYSVRAIESISGDDLTLGFNLDSAPGVGVNLGKAILYKPADENHPSLSVWDYRSNGTAVQAMAGAKVSEMSMAVEAGQLVNMSFSFAGTSFYFDPLQISATAYALDFEVDSSNYSVSLTQKYYKTPHDLALALQAAMSDASGASVSVSYSDSDGKFTVAASLATTFSADWATTANTLGPVFGFTADDTGALSYVSDDAIDLDSPYTPVLDGKQPFVAKANEIFIGDFNDNVCFRARTVSPTLTNEIVNVTSICAESGVLERLVQSRSASFEISGLLSKYDADKFEKFLKNSSSKLQLTLGNKSGGNWVPGSVAVWYMPKASIDAISLEDNDGVVEVTMTVTAFTESGEGEIYLNLL